MLRQYLEHRHINLDNGLSCSALEREYWQALEILAYDGLATLIRPNIRRFGKLHHV